MSTLRFNVVESAFRKKAAAVKHCVEGCVTHVWPISNLQTQEKGIMVCDELAASELKVSTYKYFKDIEKS